SLANAVGPPLRPRQHGVCLIVILESLSHRIPVHFSLQFHGDMMEQTGSAAPVADFYRSYGLLPRSHTLEPVGMVLLTFTKVKLLRSDDRRDDSGIAGRERLVVLQLCDRIAAGHRLIAPRDEYPPV